jgi:hypothetical protein
MNGKGRNRVFALASLGLLAGAFAALAGGGGISPGVPGDELGAAYLIGPTQVEDGLNGLTIEVPAGWYAIVPTQGTFGTTTLANYDMGTAENWLPEHSSHVLLKEMVKVDLTAFESPAGGSLDDFVTARLRSEDGPVATSRRVAHRLTGRSGVAYLTRLGLFSAVEIAMPWHGDKVLVASIHPVDTAHFDQALALVDRVALLDEVRSEPARRFRRAPLGSRAGEIRKLLRRDIDTGRWENVTAAAGACTGWAGSDNGTCAAGHSCAGNASITLNLPFQWQTWWQAGGVGAFFGNFYHGNCNRDYYAIDYNLYSSSSCGSALNDTGQRVYAAAAGTATVGSDPTGYGNYVLVSHSNGYRTRYAHLSSVNVVNGQAVGTQTIVGFVGDSGSAAGAPHLHFSYQTLSGGVLSSFCNRAGGCPNGEAARSPQTQKPSPMNTNTGSRAQTDFGCYQAPP